MRKNKTKYLVKGVIIVILISISFIGINLFKSEPKENKEKTISQEETKSMLSYTINGEKEDIKPTKESGYIANKIICENGSNLIWDNTNWEVEIIKLESNDICSVDFTIDTNINGYRITATTNVEGSIDSLSKSTIENGTIIFYPTEGQQITSVSGCTGILENNKVIVNNVTSNQTCNIEVSLKTLYATLSDEIKYSIGTRNDFSIPFGGTDITQGYNQEKTIYKTEDGNDYYFAGNPNDNWVLFANKWWRIIRTNSIEGTRLLYAGTSHNGQNGYITGTNIDSEGNYRWNISNNSTSYVQWSNASFKDTLTSWYTSNITGLNDNMVEVIVYCNDTSYNSSTQYFGAYDRVVGSKKPSHSCGTNSFGNAAKVGMMTADEVAFAGGLYNNTAPNTYYYRNSKTSGCTGNSGDPCSVTGNRAWWTMSPFRYGGTGIRARVFRVSSTTSPGSLESIMVNSSNAVRPVITLKPDVKVSGSGTTDDPFIPSLD